jgi:hypothetical protein
VQLFVKLVLNVLVDAAGLLFKLMVHLNVWFVVLSGKLIKSIRCTLKQGILKIPCFFI